MRADEENTEDVDLSAFPLANVSVYLTRVDVVSLGVKRQLKTRMGKL